MTQVSNTYKNNIFLHILCLSLYNYCVYTDVHLKNKNNRKIRTYYNPFIIIVNVLLIYDII